MRDASSIRVPKKVIVICLIMDWYSKESYCKDLPTSPVSEIGIILVSVAAGYIGGRLVPELIERGYRVQG